MKKEYHIICNNDTIVDVIENDLELATKEVKERADLNRDEREYWHIHTLTKELAS